LLWLGGEYKLYLKRVVITGIGAISHIGAGYTKLWDKLDGEMNFAEMELGSSSVKLAVDKSELKTDLICKERKLKRLLNDSAIIALHSVDDAVCDSALNFEKIKSTSVGLFIGKKDNRFFNLGKYREVAQAYSDAESASETTIGKVANSWMKTMSAIDQLKALPNLEVFILGSVYKLNGPTCTFLTPCIAGVQALQRAIRSIKSGEIDIAIVSGINDGYNEIELTRENPVRRKNRFMIGQGAATLILESMEHAQNRGAKIYSEVLTVKDYMMPFPHDIQNIKGIALPKIKKMLKECKIDEESELMAFIGSFLFPEYAYLEKELLQELFRDNNSVVYQNVRKYIGIQNASEGLFDLIISAMQFRNKQILKSITTSGGAYGHDKKSINYDYIDRKRFALVNTFSEEGFSSSVILRSC
jgi:3-oxoacyl-(acyl-carrier-protein) synthase